LNATEKRNKASIGIDEKSSLEIAKIINTDDHLVAKEISKELDVIAKAIDVAYETISSNGRLVYIGAGTSGRLGVFDASEMPPTFGVSNNVIVGLIAGGDEALRNPIEGAEDSETLIIEDLKKIKFSKNDTLMGIAASGGTPYVMAGLKYAKELGSKTIALSTNKNSKIGTIADIAIEIEVGPEIITGSTRMKSGTAQKLVINMISTGAMIKWGKVHDNLMVDIKASNDKLKLRSIGIVKEFVEKDNEYIKEKLIWNDYDVKKTIFMIIKDYSKEDVDKHYDKNITLRKLLEGK